MAFNETTPEIRCGECAGIFDIEYELDKHMEGYRLYKPQGGPKLSNHVGDLLAKCVLQLLMLNPCYSSHQDGAYGCLGNGGWKSSE